MNSINEFTSAAEQWTASRLANKNIDILPSLVYIVLIIVSALFGVTGLLLSVVIFVVLTNDEREKDTILV